MGSPIVEHPVEDMRKRSAAFHLEKRRQRLTFVMDGHEKDPGETEEQNETVQDQKRGQTGFLGVFFRTIEPEDLGEEDKKNGAITGM